MPALSQHDNGPPARHRISRLTDALGKAFLLVISLSFFILVGEVAMRQFNSHQLGKWRERADFYCYDSTLGWRGQPHVTGQFARKDFTTTIRLNSYGYRGRDYPVWSSPDLTPL